MTNKIQRINPVIRVLAAAAVALAAWLAVTFTVRNVAAAAPPIAAVDVYALNLRAGPGLFYNVLDTLVEDETVGLVGRNAIGSWVEVDQAGGPDGWMYAPYLDTDASILDLPVTTASGGPVPEVINPADTPYSLYTVIEFNVANVYLQRFPANADIVVSLARADGEGVLVVASGQTDENGEGVITFAMPAAWSDGVAVVQNDLFIQAATTDGTFNQSAIIAYYP